MMLQNIKSRLDIISVLLIIMTVGLIHSPTVLGGDQSLFAVIAQLLDSGKTLYKDMFDYKQPGIYLFYLLAGKTLGWSDVSIHLFELGYWILFSIILFYSIRNYSLFRADYSNSLLPLFIVGSYYCNAAVLHLTQLEALINVPLFLMVWLLDRAYKTENDLFVTYLAIGVLIGVILLSKLVFSPIIFFFLLIHFVFTIRNKNLKYILIKQIIPLFIGFVIPLSIFITYICTHQIENLVIDIYFRIPTSVITLTDQINPDRLLSSIKWFIKKMFVLLLLAVIGIFLITKKESHFFSLIIAWGVIGFGVILMQKTSWWSYHFQLLYVPIGVFAVMGLDFVLYHFLRKIKPSTPLIKGFLIIAIIPLIFSSQLYTLWKRTASQDYKELHILDFARNDAENIIKVIKQEDTIFICGNPRMYLLTSHLPELSINGWVLEYYLDYQWEDFYYQFKNKLPTYLFINVNIQNDYDKLIESKHLKLWELMMKEYTEFDSVKNGKWYKRI